MTMFISNRHNVEAQLNNAVKAFLEASGQYVGDRAKERAPVDRGDLRQSIQHHLAMQSIANGEVKIGSNIKYATFQERGTGIYALDGGRQTPWVYNVPGTNEFRRTRGTKPKQFIEKGGKESEPAIDALAKHIFSQIGS